MGSRERKKKKNGSRLHASIMLVFLYKEMCIYDFSLFLRVTFLSKWMLTIFCFSMPCANHSWVYLVKTHVQEFQTALLSWHTMYVSWAGVRIKVENCCAGEKGWEKVLEPDTGPAVGARGWPPRCLGMGNWREREAISSLDPVGKGQRCSRESLKGLAQAVWFQCFSPCLRRSPQYFFMC